MCSPTKQSGPSTPRIAAASRRSSGTCSPTFYARSVERGDIEAVATLHSQRIAALIPAAEIHLSGSASLPGLDPEDVDLVALVSDVPGAATILRNAYSPLYEEQWDEDWAGFRDAGPPQVDVVLTRQGSTWDARHRLAWRLLAQDVGLFAEYSALKASGQGEGDAERKREFFDRVAELLPHDFLRAPAGRHL